MYGSIVIFFCPVVMNHLSHFSRGDWNLPPSVGAEWVRKEWLDPLDRVYRENPVCLAVFGLQELELDVQNEALPHPGRTDQLSKLTTVNWCGAGHVRLVQLSLLAPSDLYMIIGGFFNWPETSPQDYRL